jgi:hypothetical protein
MTNTKLLLWFASLVSSLSAMLLTPSLEAQITVEGKVLDGSNHAVGGVDVAIYVPGNPSPIASQKSRPVTGEYHFDGLQLAGAFDIMYTHSQYDREIVSRLADQDNQHVSKVIYRKGQPRPLTAVHEQFSSARRFVFLASFLGSPNDRATFVGRVDEPALWDRLGRKIDDMTNEKVSEQMRTFLETEQRETLSFRNRLQ